MYRVIGMVFCFMCMLAGGRCLAAMPASDAELASVRGMACAECCAKNVGVMCTATIYNLACGIAVTCPNPAPYCSINAEVSGPSKHDACAPGNAADYCQLGKGWCVWVKDGNCTDGGWSVLCHCDNSGQKGAGDRFYCDVAPTTKICP